MNEKLKSFKELEKILPKKKRNSNPRGLKPTRLLKADGEDHINIGPKGETELGKALQKSRKNPFVEETYGKFNCLQGFWIYISSYEEDDECRIVSGYRLNKLKRKLTFVYKENFKELILKALYQQITQHPDTVKLVKENTLPFDDYDNTKPVDENAEAVKFRPPYYKWWLPGVEEVCLAVKEDREPVFKKL